MNAQSVEFLAQDDIRLVADAFGDPAAPAVLFAHGGGQTRHAWGGTAKLLAEKGWYAISLDQRGHGDSDWASDGDYSLESFAGDLVHIAGGLKTRPHLVGASLGGLAGIIALGSTEQTPFSSLTLVDVAPRMDEGGVDKIMGFMSEHLDTGFATLQEAADVISAYLPHRPKPKSLDGLAKNLRQDDDGRYWWHWDPAFIQQTEGPRRRSEDSVLEAYAAKIAIPTLLVRGRSSELVSEEAAAHFREIVPHTEYVDVSGAAHMVAGDKNDAFTAAVLSFLDQFRP
jgi:pimeloyl-ACP methyl ester carboxylesterase